VNRRTRSALVPAIVAGLLGTASPSAPCADLSRSLSFFYVLPARGQPSGLASSELSILTCSVYGSDTPGGEPSTSERLVEARLRVSVSVKERATLWVEPGARSIRWALAGGRSVAESGLADLRVGLRLSPPLDESLLRLGLAAEVFLPTGADKGRPGDFGPESADLSLVFLTDLDLSRWFAPHRCTVSFNLGYRWHRDAQGALLWPDVVPPVPEGEGGRYNDELLLRLGWRFTSGRLSLDAELRADSFVNAASALHFRENPICLAGRLRSTLHGDWWVGLGGEVSIASGSAATSVLAEPEELYPDWVVRASLGAPLFRFHSRSSETDGMSKKS
jgi:hypothetical protein